MEPGESGTPPRSTDPAPPPSPSLHEPPSDLVCSARGCTGAADFGLQWNNPSLHTPERRKTWLACAGHREHLSQFLATRGFLREVVEVGRSRA
ncbi:hypothetical protein FHR75_003792 [Kineococcus radiotolerans]|uniref:Acetone carboxylase n=2 Tax=Kineococcus radiotolerans TaxID=131568 RepID=A6WC31_KINRD|nr:hypothetical protein [Kineococcus radiotolerans]ABS04370.1 hypothetical protein Krad_2906 [Kineococcus radiotolerans SRS30216 = ATCC BAA-149]MBB2902956.1 hypothetical protein [Kineococcus radiotolerans]